MLKEYARVLAGAVFAVDLLLVSVAFSLAHWLRSDVFPQYGLAAGALYPISSYLPLLPVALVIWAGLLLRSRIYRSHRTVPLSQEVWDLLRICVSSGIVFILTIYLLRLDRLLPADDRISRFWIVLVVGASFLVLLVEKLALRLTSHYFRARGRNFRAVLIVGTSDTAKALADSVDRHRFWGFKVLGFVALEPPTPGERILGRPVVGTVEDLLTVVESLAVDEVVFTVNPDDISEFEEQLHSLQQLGVSVRFALKPVSQMVGRVELEALDGIPLISYLAVPSNAVQLTIKRTGDMLLAGLLLALLLPVMVVVAMVIKASSTGGVFYRQTRVGLNGRHFTMFKFRTMVERADENRESLLHLNEMHGPVFKVAKDPRTTKIGTILRKFSLDELPQLWNVLKGEMSLVGPRPPLPEEVSRYERWQRRRLSMRPGLTCLWQVSGRNKVDFEEWMRLDLRYIDNWSPWLDLKILLRTIPVVLGGSGAS